MGSLQSDPSVVLGHLELVRLLVSQGLKTFHLELAFAFVVEESHLVDQALSRG